MAKIIFFGTPQFSVSILNELILNNNKILCVFTQPPKKSNRGQKITKSEIQKFSEKSNIKLRTPINLENNDEEYQYIKKLGADIAIVVAYGQIIPKRFLYLTKKGFINIHASLLPKYRGAAPIQRAIINLEKKTGISIMRMTEKLDSGPVCKIYELNISEKDSYKTLSEKLSKLASQKISENLKNIMDDKIKFTDQDHKEATYAKKIRKSEALINWNMPANKILGLINALCPSPGAFFYFEKKRYKILEAKVSKNIGKVGIVIDNFLNVGCKENSIKINLIQREGKKPQKTQDFIIGSKIKKGSNLN